MSCPRNSYDQNLTATDKLQVLVANVVNNMELYLLSSWLSFSAVKVKEIELYALTVAGQCMFIIITATVVQTLIKEGHYLVLL